MAGLLNTSPDITYGMFSTNGVVHGLPVLGRRCLLSMMQDVPLKLRLAVVQEGLWEASAVPTYIA